jgi:hypothetical protein
MMYWRDSINGINQSGVIGIVQVLTLALDAVAETDV